MFHTRSTVAAAALLMAFFPVEPMEAQHVVWVDYETRPFLPQVFDNSSLYNNRSWNAVKQRIIHHLARDYANYEVYFVTDEPRAGRYTRLVIGGSGGSALGTSLDSWYECPASECGEELVATDHGSWRTHEESIAFVFSDNFAGSQLTGSNATIERISAALARTASHELGHILGLEHWFAVDSYEDGFDLPQNSSAVTVTDDDWKKFPEHVMASDMNISTRLTVDPRFSPHISNEHLMRNMQTRGYHLPLGEFGRGGGPPGRADLLIGDMGSPTAVSWDVALSSGRSFGTPQNYRSDGGDPTDIFLTGDVDGDGDTDLVYGRPMSATTVRWYVRKTTPQGFSGYSTWSSDAGDVGDVFRLGDVTGDGRADLVYGRPVASRSHANAIRLKWYVRPSSGTAFGRYSEWLGSGGYQGHPVFLRDFDGDGRDDLVTAYIPIGGQTGRWDWNRSLGNRFASGARLYSGTGVDTDRFFLDDVHGDGAPDLIIGRRMSRNRIRWYVRQGVSYTNRSGVQAEFSSSASIYAQDIGNSGDYFRVGDVNGDGRADLVVQRRDNPTGSRTWASLSQVSSFASPRRWGDNRGEDGQLVY